MFTQSRMRSITVKSVAIASMTFTSACANIPIGAESANSAVSIGVQRLSADTETILDAYRQSLRLAVQAEFSHIHDAAEDSVRAKRGVAAGTPLNDDQRQEVSGIVLIVFEKAHELIDQKIAETKATVQKNTATVKTANDEITKLLASARQVGTARSEIIETMKDLVPLPDISGLIDEAIALTQQS
ncbi:MAG: hypothetical protein KTR23_09765 [Rhodospirillales bacterium]|nr:hypothetical protein [Rhodospirillales bacterium]